MSRGGIVHVIDDDEAVRDSLAMLLDAVGFSVTAHVSAAAFLDRLDRAPSGCIVTDVCMPEVSGLDLLRRLSDRLAQFPVIVLTGEADVPMAVEALKNGARDFIEKPYPPDAIIEAVSRALERMQADTGREMQRVETARRIAALSAREREVLQGLLDGASNKEIARELGISPRTVEAYRANLMMKMGADSLSELVRMALEAREPG